MVMFEISKGCGRRFTIIDAKNGEHDVICIEWELCPVCQKNNELVHQMKEARERAKERFHQLNYAKTNVNAINKLFDECFEVKE